MRTCLTLLLILAIVITTNTFSKNYNLHLDFNTPLKAVKSQLLANSQTTQINYIDSNSIGDKYKFAFGIPFTESKAFNFLFENFDGKKSKWLIDKKMVEEEVLEFSDGKALTTKTSLIDSLDIDGNKNYILVTISTSKNPDNSNLYLFSVYVFIKSDDKIFIRISDSFLTYDQTYGDVAQPVIRMMGKSKIGIVIELWDSHMGIETTYTKIFTEYKDTFNNAITIESNVNNSPGGFSADEPSWEYDAVYNFIENPKSEYYDLITLSTD